MKKVTRASAGARMGQFLDVGSIERLRRMADGELAWFKNEVMGFIEELEVNSALQSDDVQQHAFDLLTRIVSEAEGRKKEAREPSSAASTQREDGPRP